MFAKSHLSFWTFLYQSSIIFAISNLKKLDLDLVDINDVLVGIYKKKVFIISQLFKLFVQIYEARYFFVIPHKVGSKM